MPNIIYRWTHLHKDRMFSCNTSSLNYSNNCWDDNIQDVSNSCNTDTSQRSLFRMRIISYSNWIKVYVSMETVVLRRWRGGVVIKRWFGFINWIKNEIGYVSSFSPSSERIRRAIAKNTSFWNSLRRPVYIDNLVDKTESL